MSLARNSKIHKRTHYRRKLLELKKNRQLTRQQLPIFQVAFEHANQQEFSRKIFEKWTIFCWFLHLSLPAWNTGRRCWWRRLSATHFSLLLLFFQGFFDLLFSVTIQETCLSNQSVLRQHRHRHHKQQRLWLNIQSINKSSTN